MPGEADEGVLLLKTLEASHWSVLEVPTPVDLPDLLQQRRPFAALINVPGRDSPAHQQDVVDLLQQVRERGLPTPLICLARGAEVSERVGYLNAGADDVLARPFAFEELLARLRVWSRRSRMGQRDVAGDDLRCRDLTINTASRVVNRAGRLVKLTVKEYDLLLHLMRHQGQVQERLQILHAVWGDNFFGDPNLLEVYIRYLRKKLERPELAPLIHTVRGVGYMLQ
ncbi:response regulator transcription factor [Synechococcus sp. RSCCF101]|uniref:response regulator transcription factor n=1 Tax=Synechococcus sp. RSCCF101 TaxID=2511069 RepID=UPI00124638ED|nr:response regulator transcription factor [Synechococcus sp. RSCCF101]QEY31873.1 response regulator transcription factor [Synechococcus sp. RSCCF101]